MPVARKLRRNATDAEQLLWRHLRARQLSGVKFRRQLVIGGFVTDFATMDLRLIIELDGGQHAAAIDAPRTAALAAAGWHVIRFWNHDILTNIDGVLAVILQEISNIRAHNSLLP